MITPAELSQKIRELFLTGNWTCTNLKDMIADVDWKMATQQVGSLNTIAKLVFHIDYYVEAVNKVLGGGQLTAHDKYSFDMPEIKSQSDWEELVAKAVDDAEQFAAYVENLPNNKLTETFADPKYGNYLKNIYGIIDHTHYHLGQIGLIKKMLTNQQ